MRAKNERFLQKTSYDESVFNAGYSKISEKVGDNRIHS